MGSALCVWSFQAVCYQFGGFINWNTRCRRRFKHIYYSKWQFGHKKKKRNDDDDEWNVTVNHSLLNWNNFGIDQWLGILYVIIASTIYNVFGMSRRFSFRDYSIYFWFQIEKNWKSKLSLLLSFAGREWIWEILCSFSTTWPMINLFTSIDVYT